MRFTLPVTMIFFISIGHATADVSLEHGHQFHVEDAESVESILEPLEAAVWISDGGHAEKPVYVLFNAACGWSGKFFNDTRASLGNAQLRWIPATSVSEDFMLSERSSEALNQSFNGNPGAVEDYGFSRRASLMNSWATREAMEEIRHLSQNSQFTFPILVYRTDSGLRVISGNPKNFSDVTKEVATQADSEKGLSRGVRIANTDYTVHRAFGIVVADERDMKIRSHPHDEAPTLTTLEAGYQMRATGEVQINGNMWDQVEAFTDGTPGYISRTE